MDRWPIRRKVVYQLSQQGMIVVHDSRPNIFVSQPVFFMGLRWGLRCGIHQPRLKRSWSRCGNPFVIYIYIYILILIDTLHYIALHCIALHHIALHYSTVHDMTWHYITTVHYTTDIHSQLIMESGWPWKVIKNEDEFAGFNGNLIGIQCDI